MTENRCATCRHWRNPWSDHPEPSDRDWRAPVSEVEEPAVWGTCTMIALHDSYDPKVTGEVLAFTKDASDYIADLHTRRDFGCVLWEDRP